MTTSQVSPLPTISQVLLLPFPALQPHGLPWLPCDKPASLLAILGGAVDAGDAGDVDRSPAVHAMNLFICQSEYQ